MKRFILCLLLLATGAALGVGGLYVGLNWDKYNPFRDKDGIAAKTALTKLRQACATEVALKGAFIKSAEVADGKLVLQGFVADKKQRDALEAACTSLIEETVALKSQCENGLTTERIKIVALAERLPLWQREFEECKGAEKDDADNALKREVMRTTRLDGLTFNEEGKLTISGINVRGNKATETTGKVLYDLLKNRIEEAGISPELMPDFAINIGYHPNPAVALQNKLANVAAAKDVRILSAWYDGGGKLHIEALVSHEDQRKHIDESINAMLKDPKTLELVISPDAKEAVTDDVVRAIVFEGEAEAKKLQKKLVEHARKDEKPHLRQVRLAKVVPTAIVNEKNEMVADEEGNPRYAFRVTGRLLASDADRKRIESDLADWLEEALPRMTNPNQSPVLPKLELNAKASPVLALQERVVQRGLDGAVFTDALFDGDGRLEISGRLHQPGDDAKKLLESAVQDLLADEMPWSLVNLKPHEASKDGAPLAWSAAVKICQEKLAADAAAGQRVRLDRLYFAYVKEKLRLVADGVFVTNGPGDSADASLQASVDGAILSRSKAEVMTTSLKSIGNPIAGLQNLFGQRADLDGVLLTSARFDADGRLQFDGFVGQPEQKNAMRPLVSERLSSIPELVKKGGDPKAGPAWSIDGLKPHAAAKGEWKWPDLVRAIQSDIAAEPSLRRYCLERVYFRYAEPVAAKPNAAARQLQMRFQSVVLTGPAEKADATAVTKVFGVASARLLPAVNVTQTDVDLRSLVTPTLELQKWAVAQKHDGVFFRDAFYDANGKLVLEGLRGSDLQVKSIQTRVAELADSKESRGIAPFGVADLAAMKLSPWGAMLERVRNGFADDDQVVLKQTRIDRAYFTHDEAGGKARIRFEGITLYQGKTPSPEQAAAAVAAALNRHLEASGVAGFELVIAGIEKKANPVLDLQKKAIDARMDGVVFSHIGFDAKGACYVKLPLVPAGQAANIRKLLDEAARTHPHLGTIGQR